MAAPQLYLGSTPTDLRTTRHQVTDLLQSLGYEVIDAATLVSRVGEEDSTDLPTMLRRHLPAVTGMVHLIGTSYAHPAIPSPATASPSSEHFSLAQFEQHLAQEFSIPCYTYLLGEDFPCDDAPIDEPRLQVQQHRHRKHIQSQPSGWESIDTLDQLLRRLKRITYRLEELRSTLPPTPPAPALNLAPTPTPTPPPLSPLPIPQASTASAPTSSHPIPPKAPSSWDTAPMDGSPSTSSTQSTPSPSSTQSPPGPETIGARIGRYFSYVVYLILISIVTTTARQCFRPEKKTYSYPSSYPYSENFLPPSPRFEPAPFPWPSDLPLNDPTLTPSSGPPTDPSTPTSSTTPKSPKPTPSTQSSSPPSSPITPLPPPSKEDLAAAPPTPPRDTAAGIYGPERLSILLACSAAEARARHPGCLWLRYDHRAFHAIAVQHGKTPEQISATVFEKDFWNDIIVSNHQRPLREAFHTRVSGPKEKTVAHADHAITLAQAAQPRDIHSERLAWIIKGDSQLEATDYTSALTSYRRALACTDVNSHTLTWCDISDRIGHTLRCAGLWSEANAVLVESIHLREKAAGNDTAALSDPITDLAWTTHARTGTPQAITLLRRALEIDTAQLGPRNPRTVERMIELASMLDPISQHKEVITLLRSAVEIEDERWGNASHMLTEVLCQLSTALEAGRQGPPAYTEAEQLARRAIQMLSKRDDEDDDASFHIPLTNTTLHVRMLVTLASALRAQDRTAEAAEVTRQAYDILAKFKNVRDADVNLAWHWERVLQLAGMLPTGTSTPELIDKAEGIVQCVEKNIGPDHTTLAVMLESVAASIEAIDLPRAVHYSRRAAQIASRQHGPHHPQTLHYLAQLLKRMHQQRLPIAEMRPFIETAVANAQKRTSSDDSRIGIDLILLEKTLRDIKHEGPLLPIARTAAAIFEQSVGPDHPLTIVALTSLRDSLLHSRQEREARTLTTRIDTFHAAHPTAPTTSTQPTSGKPLRTTFTDDYITEQMLEVVVVAAQRPYPSASLITPKQAIQDAITITADTLSADRRAYHTAIMEKARLTQKETFPYPFVSMTRHFFLEDYARAQKIGHEIRTHKDSSPALRALGALIETSACRLLRRDATAIETASEGRTHTRPGSMFWANLTFLIARSHLDMGDTASAIREYESLVKSTEDTRDGNILRATAMRDLAEALIQSAPTARASIATTYARAEQYLRTALRDHEKHAPAFHEAIARDQIGLARVITLIGGPGCADADEMNGKAIITLGSLLTPQHPDLIQLHVIQGDAFTGSLNFDKAQISLRRAQSLCEFHGGKSSPTMRGILVRLGMLELPEKKYQAAIPLLTSALSMKEGAVADMMAEQITIHSALALAHQAQGDATTARGHFRRALDLARSLQSEDPCARIALAGRYVYTQEQSHQAALEFLSEAIDLARSHTTVNEYALMNLLDARSTCYHYSKSKSREIADLEEAAAIEEKLDTISLRPSADIRRELSYTLKHTGRYAESEAVHRRALAAVGAAHKRTGINHFEIMFLPATYRMLLRSYIPSMSDEELEERIDNILAGKPVPDISHLIYK